MKRYQIVGITICIFLLLFIIYSKFIGQEQQNQIGYVRAKVTSTLNNDESDIISIQIVKITILEGIHKGYECDAKYQLNYDYIGELNTIQLSVGDQVFVHFYENKEGVIEDVYIVEIARDRYLGYLILGFIVLLLLIGRSKGLKAIISLFITIASIFKILLPSILKGHDPIIVTILLCIGIICISLMVIGGINKKTIAAILGTSGGVVFAGIIAIFVGSLAKITGLGQEETQMLIEIPQNLQLDLSGILFCGIIIGTMGATMDVAISVASAMHEIKLNSPRIKTLSLISAGMNVGKDAMATMANTLILAYTGGSIQLMLLLMAYDTPFVQIVNWDMISAEILRAIAGSMGIIIAIPITAIISGIIENA